jgi:tight adherence protein C
MTMFLISALIFVTVSAAIMAAAYVLVPTKLGRRLESMNEREEKSEWTETVANIVGPFARLSAPDGNWEDSPLRIRFINAGLRKANVRAIFFGTKTLLPLAFALLAFILLRGATGTTGMTLLMWLSIAALIGCYLPNMYLYLRGRARKRAIFDGFPDAADLMLVCVEAGLGLDAALSKVTDEIQMQNKPLAEELHLTNLEMRAGGSREKALRNLAVRTGIEEVSTFATMMTQSDKFGTSVADSLRVFSDDLRHKRQMRAEERAAKIPTKMLFPLVLFIFPSIMMVVLGPAGIRIIRTIAPMINGQ